MSQRDEPFAGGGSCLGAEGCRQSGWWLLEAGVALASSQDQTAMQFAARIHSPRQQRFLCSTRGCLTAFYPQQNLFQNGSPSSQTLCCVINKLTSYSKSFVVTSTFAAPSPVDSIPRNHCLRSSVRGTSSSVQVRSRDRSRSAPSSGSTSDLPLLLFLPPSAATSPTEVLNPSKLSLRVGIHCCETLYHVGILTSSHESRYSYWHLEWAILSRRFSVYFARIHQRITICGGHSLVKCIS